MSYEKNIPLASLLCEDAYTISYPLCDETLIASIRTIGVQYPIVVEKNNEQYIVLHGMRRVAAARALGHTDIPARVVESTNENTRIKTFLHTLYENIGHRTFNDIEKARVIRILTTHEIADTEFRDICTRIGVQCNEYSIQRLLRFDTAGTELQQRVFKGMLHSNTVLDILCFSDDEQQMMLHVTDQFGLNANMSKEIVELCKELIALKTFSSLHALFNAINVDSLHTEAPTRNHAIETLRWKLRCLRYPALCAAEQQFEELKKTWDLPSGVTITHMPFFEREGITLEVHGKDVEDVKTKIKIL